MFNDFTITDIRESILFFEKVKNKNFVQKAFTFETLFRKMFFKYVGSKTKKKLYKRDVVSL